MSNSRHESHLAQQIRRDKLRIQNSFHHLQEFPNNNPEKLSLHQGFNLDIQVRNVRNANMLVDESAAVYSSEMAKISSPSPLPRNNNTLGYEELGEAEPVKLMMHQHSLVPHSSYNSLGNENTFLASDFNNNVCAYQHYGKQSYNELTDTQSSLSREIQKQLGANVMHHSSSYQNALQDIVKSSASIIGCNGSQMGSLIQQTSQNIWGGDPNELEQLQPSYANQPNHGLRFGSGNLWTNRPLPSDSTPQSLSLSLSSNSQSKPSVSHFEEASASACVSDHGISKHPPQYVKPSIISRNSGKSPLQDYVVIPNPNTTSYRNVGPLGPFTGYATILKSSSFLKSAQQLLEEFYCVSGPTFANVFDVPERVSGEVNASTSPSADTLTINENGGFAPKGGNSGSSSSMFYSANENSTNRGSMSSFGLSPIPDYQQKKAKLLFMKEKVGKRYKQYHQQMQMIVSSFESVAGLNSATPYVSLALKSISKHFRCLQNSISDQLKHISEVSVEDIPTRSTSSKIETNMANPSCMDQSFQKNKVSRSIMGLHEPQQHVWRPQRGLPEPAVAILKAWLFEHFLHPYPTDNDKHMLATQTGLSRNQVSNWFINARVRLWKPMVEEIHMLETKGITGNNTSKNAGTSCTEGGRVDKPLSKFGMHSIPESQFQCNNNAEENGINDEEQWSEEKRSKLEFQMMGFVPYQSEGALGSVSLTLGLRHGVEGPRVSLVTMSVKLFTAGRADNSSVNASHRIVCVDTIWYHAVYLALMKFAKCQMISDQMANGTHSSHKSKAEEINNRRPMQVGEKEKINPPSNVSDATGLRRSAREASSTKLTTSPSTTRKSERLEKKTTPTPAVCRKSQKVEKPNMPSPLRRSGRNKNHSFSSPPDSKSSGSSSSKQKSKKEKTVKQLIFEAKEVTENDEHNVGTPQVKVKRMDARMYRATFMKPKKDCPEKPNTIDKSTQEGGTDGGGKIDECCRLSGDVKGLLENSSTPGLLVPSNATTHETRLAPQSVQLDCNGEETSQMLVSTNVVSDENLVGSNVGLDSGEKMIKRKGTMVDKVSNVYSTLSNDNNCTLIGEAGPSRLGGNIVGTDSPCSKRRRLDYDSTVSHCNKSCNPSTVEEPGQRSSVNKLSQLPGRVSSRFGNNNLLESVNKLREHWQKGQSAIVIDDHERILKVVAFIATLQSDIYRPFLIISTAASLHSWEDEFHQLDPSIDVAIYNGNKEMRNSIRRSELYDEGGCILFQVLIVVPHILIEDLDVLLGIEWEAIIVDECQSPKISSYFKQIKMLNKHLTVLLFRDQLKDSIEENINILSLLDCQSGNEKDDSTNNSSNNVTELKKRLLSHIAYKCQTDFFRFVEYWVPVQISHVQLEQYCGILLSNASILRSSSKVDTVGPLRDVLNSTQKCCNHPYVLNPSLQPLLTEGLQTTSPEFLDVGCKASGKLQLLDSMLKELRKKDLRALVLFQSIGGSGILVDFLLLRFGQDSYEGIDRSSPLSKKQSAMKKFNNKDNGCFVFLLETIACHSSIKLSSVDAVIIFNSDLNPMNDIRSLQKITLDSQFEFIKIFRLYSSFTVEEKALIFAKQDKTLDINIQNISPSTSHMLLMWGASCLFDDLRVFHDGETSVSSLKSLFGGEPHLKAAREFSSILSQDGENNDTSNYSFLLKVQPDGGKYRGDFSLLGEQKLRSLDEEAPHIFWTKLLEGKQFKWKYSCGLSQRSRKKVHHVNGSLDRPDPVSESISKKRRKVSNNTVDQPSSKSGGQKSSAGVKAGTSKNPSGDLAGNLTQLSLSLTTYVGNIFHINCSPYSICLLDQISDVRDPSNGVESEKNSRLHDEQRSLHLLLKPEIAKFCEVLLLPDNVKSTVDNFLGYVINNHRVPREPVSISQAFQISLIWAAASFVKHNLDQNASLILAKEILNFDCKKVEVEYLYSMLRCLKNIFLYRTGIFSDAGSPKASESRNEVYSCTGREVELFKKDISKSIKETKKKLKKKLTKLFSMQLEEKQRLKAAIEDEKTYFESKYKLESAAIQHCSPNDVVREEKLKDLGSEYAKKIGELKCEHETRLKDLEDMQSAKIRDFQDQEAAWVEELMSWAKNELSNIDASKELGNEVEYLQTCDEALPHNGLKNVDPVSAHFTEGKDHDDMVEAMTGTTTGVPETNSLTLELCSGPVELQTPLPKHTGANGMSIMASEDRPVSRSEDHNIAENEKIFYGNTSTVDEGYGRENFSRGSRDPVDEVLDRELSRPCGSTSPSSDPHNITLSNSPLEHQNPDGISSCIHDRQFPVEVPETVDEWRTVSVLEREIPAEMPGVSNFTDCPANATPVDIPSENQISIGDSIDVPVLDNGLSSRPCGPASPRGGTVTNPILNQQQIFEDVSVSIPDGDIPVIVPENSHAVADCHNNVEPLTNAGLVRTTSGQREGVPIAMTECTLSQDTPVSRSVDAMESLEQVQQLSSAESPPDQDIAGELQNSSKQVGLVSSPVDIIPANQSNHASLVTSPLESVQQLTYSELPSSNPDPSNIHLVPAIEHQPINEDDLPFHDPETSNVVPNQDVVQPDPNLGLDSHSRQVVMHPASNSNLSSLSPGGAGTQPSDTRNLSTLSGISHHNHPIQTATHSASGFLSPLCSEPLKYELERIQQVTEKVKQNHEDMKLQLKSDFEKEYAELRMKYDIKFQEIEFEFQQTKKNLDTSLNAVLMNKILADAFRSKCMVLKPSGALGIHQDAGAAHLLPQHSRQRGATHPSMVAGPSSCAPPAPSLHNPSTTTSPQNVVPPIQPTYRTSGVFSSVPSRPPLINSVSSPLGGSTPPLINSVSSSLGGLQAGGEIRAPAPHLRPYSPSTSVPATGLPAFPRGIPRQPAPSNTPASSAFSHSPPRQPAPSNTPASSVFSHGPPRPRPTSYQSDPRRPDNAGGLPSANLSPVDLPNFRPRMSHDTPLNPPGVCIINSTREAPDYVYLSDDD
ncbi:unnamed protein product [Lupinus luteus]|uniref:Uncharacterized protein n=1 Tax=Lupinus luteus TaxID=3873 RepID=A0AAV1YEQ4_LUPLU